MLHILDLDLSYPGYPPLARVSWAIAEGSQVALLGRSGVGKSTLLKAILRHSRHPEVQTDARHIGYLSQQPALLPWRSVLDNVLLGKHLRGEAILEEDQDRAMHVLDEVGLHNLSQRRPATLSGGQQARVALARTLFEQNDLVLLDEPFAGLDRSTRIQLANLFSALLPTQTVIMVTHDPRDAGAWLHQSMVLTECTLEGPFPLTTFLDDEALVAALEGPTVTSARVALG